LRFAVPENRVQVYDMRKLITLMADEDSVQELRPDYGSGMVTMFIRIEGQPFGLFANDPAHLGGAIDSEGGEKGARFLQLCDTYGLPVISLCDTPGYMVGPESEVTASVRRGSRLLATAATLSVPLFSVVTRKGYGLGAQAMVGGSFQRPAAIVSWPTGEFGPMGLEGGVRLGFKRELDAEAEGPARDALYEKLVAQAYQQGKAVSVAAFAEIDAVIDPAETRKWLLAALQTTGLPKTISRKFADIW
jgi:acetyl-CoA carboxylase carboxyltransferase component